MGLLDIGSAAGKRLTWTPKRFRGPAPELRCDEGAIARYAEKGLVFRKRLVETSTGTYAFSLSGSRFSVARAETEYLLARGRINVGCRVFFRAMRNRSDSVGSVEFTDGPVYSISTHEPRTLGGLHFTNREGCEVMQFERDAITVAALEPPPSDDHLSVLVGLAWLISLHSCD